MGCSNISIGSGKCKEFDSGIEIGGCNEEGICICENDEDPSATCAEYNSDEVEDYGDDAGDIDDCNCDGGEDCEECWGGCCEDTCECGIGDDDATESVEGEDDGI